MKRILLTAFEPFGGLDLNASKMVLDKINERHRGAVVTKMTLPVLYASAFEILRKEIEAAEPDIVICMGQAGGRDKICVERVAVNINSGRLADNAGVLKKDTLIIQNGREAYFTNLPYKDMIAAGGEDAAVSHSAGTYICNDIFYRLMAYIEGSDTGMIGGFLHLPYTEHFGKMPYINLETQTGTVENMLSVLGEDDEHQD